MVRIIPPYTVAALALVASTILPQNIAFIPPTVTSLPSSSIVRSDSHVVFGLARDFSGQFPSGGEEAFDKALLYLSPNYDGDDDEFLLTNMESTFRTLDSEMIRGGCSREAREVVDELWRIIKLMYNGASLKEAQEARDAAQIQGDNMKNNAIANEAYKQILEYLNPQSVASTQVTLTELKRAFDVLDSKPMRERRTDAQGQVLAQLAKTIETATSSQPGVTVSDAIKKTWLERDRAARLRLREP